MHAIGEQVARLARTAGTALARLLAKHLCSQVETQEILADRRWPGNQQAVMPVITAQQFFSGRDKPGKVR